MTNSNCDQSSQDWWRRQYAPYHDRYTHPFTVNFLNTAISVQQSPKFLGASCWDSSLILSGYLAKYPEEVAGKRCVELGAGVGIAGIAAYHLGGDVTLTDLPEIMPILTSNIEANKGCRNLSSSYIPAIRGSANCLSQPGCSEAKELVWGDKVAAERLRPPFDVILMADVMYTRKNVEPLIASLLHLAGPSTSVLHAQENHQVDVVDSYLTSLSQHFSVTEVSKDQLDEVYRSPSITLWKCKLRSE